jgi:hypothetical protein
MEKASFFENFGPIYQTAQRLIQEEADTECCKKETQVHVNSNAYRGFSRYLLYPERKFALITLHFLYMFLLYGRPTWRTLATSLPVTVATPNLVVFGF